MWIWAHELDFKRKWMWKQNDLIVKGFVEVTVGCVLDFSQQTFG